MANELEDPRHYKDAKADFKMSVSISILVEVVLNLPGKKIEGCGD